LVFVTCIYSFSQNLAPTIEHSVDQHLSEVNPVWESEFFLDEVVYFDDETARIKFHFERVVERLEAHTQISEFENKILVNRKKLINLLESYKERGDFPKNDFYPNRRPVFKDHYQTSCAVAYLMEETGESALASRIQRTNNYDKISVIAEVVPEVGDWAAMHGFSLEELKLIQPSYPADYRNFYSVGSGGGPVDGNINVMVTDKDEKILFMAGDFKEMDGQAANSIIAWDGENWLDMGAGVDGVVLDMVYDTRYDRLIIVGDFALTDDPEFRNVAYWKDGQWKGLQRGDMQGVIKTVEINFINIFIGGDFKSVDGEPISFLAKREQTNDDNAGWTDQKDPDFAGSQRPGEFAVNGPVNVMTTVEDRLLIAGDFSMTAPEADTSSVMRNKVDNVTYWTNNTFFEVEGPDFNEINAAGYVDGRLFLVDSTFQEEMDVARIHCLKAGLWDERIMIGNWGVDGMLLPACVSGFLGDGETTYIHGEVMELWTLVNQAGFVDLNGSKGVAFDGAVHSAIIFQDRIYYGGDFTHPEGSGLVSSAIETGSPDATLDLELTEAFKVYAANAQLHLSYEDLEGPAEFSLFNMNGRRVDSFTLKQGNYSMNKSYEELASGNYVYQIQKGGRMTAGKLFFY